MWSGIHFPAFNGILLNKKRQNFDAFCFPYYSALSVRHEASHAEFLASAPPARTLSWRKHNENTKRTPPITGQIRAAICHLLYCGNTPVFNPAPYSRKKRSADRGVRRLSHRAPGPGASLDTDRVFYSRRAGFAGSFHSACPLFGAELPAAGILFYESAQAISSDSWRGVFCHERAPNRTGMYHLPGYRRDHTV